MEHIYDVIIIGGGPAGYTAALYAARAGLDTVVLEKLSAGGQMALTHQIDNYPGFEAGINGFSLSEKMQAGAERFGTGTVLTEVTSSHLSAAVKTVGTGRGTFSGRTVIIAAGAVPRKLGLPGETELLGRGVSYCAACDGMFYRDRTVAVVGGGNSAAADALLLSRLCRKVILIHRRDTLRATKVYHTPLFNAPNVEFCWDSAVTGLIYGDQLTALRLRNLKSGRETELPVDGVFVSIGRAPASERFKAEVATDPNGYLIADESTQTNLPGVFAAGDIRTKTVRQIVTAAADGAAAAFRAEEYLASL